MTQEDGYIEVKCYLTNRVPIIRWVRPVKTKKLRMLFDVFAMMVMARDSGVNFSDMQEMQADEQMAWMVYGGLRSYASLKNRRLDVPIETVIEWIDGILLHDRAAILETIGASRSIGKLAESYQEAREAMAEEAGTKKVPGQVSGQMS